MTQAKLTRLCALLQAFVLLMLAVVAGPNKLRAEGPDAAATATVEETSVEVTPTEVPTEAPDAATTATVEETSAEVTPTESTTEALETITEAPTTITAVEVPVTDRAVITAPAAVTNLKATGLKNGSIQVSWTGNAEATYYAIYAQRPGSSVMPYLSIAYGNSFTDTKAQAGYNFYRVYAVKVVDGTQYFSKSTGYVFAKSAIDYAPSPVTNLKAVALKDGSIQVSWTGNTDATYYAIFAQRPGSSTMPYLTIAYGNSIIDTKAQPGYNFYRVFAVNVVNGTQHFSKSTGYVYANSNVSYAPAPVTGLKAADRQDGTLGVSWQAVPNATYYAVYRKGPNTTDAWQYRGIANGTGYIDPMPFTGYNFYRVSAVRVVNDKQHFSPMTSYAYAKPTNFKLVTATDLRSFEYAESYEHLLSWSNVDEASSYDVFRSTSIDSTLRYLGSVTDNSYSDTTRPVNCLIYYQVRPVKVVDGRRIVGNLSEKEADVARATNEGFFVRSIGEDVFALINQFRRENNVPELRWDESAYATVSSATEVIGAHGYLAHTGWGDTNIGQGLSDPVLIFKAWESSPGHRAGMLDEEDTHGAVAWYFHPDNGFYYAYLGLR